MQLRLRKSYIWLRDQEQGRWSGLIAQRGNPLLDRIDYRGLESSGTAEEEDNHISDLTIKDSDNADHHRRWYLDIRASINPHFILHALINSEDAQIILSFPRNFNLETLNC